MRPSLSFKVLLRTPFKTLLTFFLIAVVSLALFSRVAEYTITNREIVNATKSYRGVGSVEINAVKDTYPDTMFYMLTDPRVLQHEISQEYQSSFLARNHYTPLSRDQISAVQKLSYISSCDTRYMTAGVSDKYLRMDEGKDYYNHTARFVLEGTLSHIEYDVITSFDVTRHMLHFTDYVLLAGDPAWLSAISDEGEIIIRTFPDKDIAGSAIGNNKNSREITTFFAKEYRYDTEFVSNLKISDRYVIVGRVEPLYCTPPEFYAGDRFTDYWCDAIQSIKDQPDNYLETNEFASLRELIEITNTDLHTFDVVYTEDMLSIMRFAKGDMMLKGGRLLTREDSRLKSDVCVINGEFARQNNLDLGDKMTLKLGTGLFEQYKNLGAVASARERYSPPVKTAELEIVGIYMDTDGKKVQLKRPNWSYSINTVFVPGSLLPLDENKLDSHLFSPSEFSFVVDNAYDISSFIDEVIPRFKEMELTPSFYDNGWLDLADNFELSTRLSIIAILAISGALFVAIGFIVYLFIGRKKREYAIMRALGTTRKTAARTLILPLMALSVSAVIVGSTAAWIYTTATVAGTNAALSSIKNYAVNTSVPVFAALGCIFGEIALILLFTLFGLWRVGSIPPLALLLDNQNRRVHRPSHKNALDSKVVKVAAKTHATVSLPKTSVSDNTVGKIKMNTGIQDASVALYMTCFKRKRTCSHVMRYIVKHMTRSAVKSLLALLLSALLVAAVGQFAIMRQSYMDLCKSIIVKARFTNVSLDTMGEIAKTDYVKDLYYELTNSADVNYVDADWVVTNDISRYTEEAAEVIYGGGYDESCMKEMGEVCIIGGKLLEAKGLKPGEKVFVTGSGAFEGYKRSFIKKYRDEHPDEAASDEEIFGICYDEIMKELQKQGMYYMIAGSVKTPSGNYDYAVFSPGTTDTSPIYGFQVPLDLAEFTLADNMRVGEFRKYAERKSSVSSQMAFFMDTSKIDDLMNTMNLLAILFPVIVVAAVIIGSVLAGLIIIQSSKEAATLRVLGTTRRRTCVILTIEQVLLCVIGLAVGVGGLLLYNGAVLAEIADKLYLFGALYFAGCLASTVVCSLVATHGNGLKLLQVKE